MSTETIKTGWLKDKNGDKFAPKTLSSQVQTADGVLLEDKLQDDLNAAKAVLKEDIDKKIDTDTVAENYEAKTDAEDKLAEAKAYTDSKTSGLASISSVNTSITTHNTSAEAHIDIRDLISALTIKLNTFLDVDDTTADQLSEVLTLIENNKGTLESLTSSKVNVADIVDDLTTNVANKPLSAAQGVAIKALIDELEEVLNKKAELVHGNHVPATQDANDAVFLRNDNTWQTVTPENIGATTMDAVANEFTVRLGRNNAVNAADTNYTTYMARGTSLNSAETNPTVNGTIAWTYE